MVICHGKKFIFVHTYKVAGTSIRDAVQAYTIPPKESYLRWIGQKLGALPKSSDFDGHITAAELQKQLKPEMFNNYYKFCFVRNPWDWQVSLYHFAQQEATHHQNQQTKGMSFEEYIDWRVHEDLHLQKEFMYDDKNNCLVDFVGKMENINDDFQKICNHIGIQASLPHANKSKHKKYMEYYNDKTRDLVAEYFKEDIELFNYTFED